MITLTSGISQKAVGAVITLAAACLMSAPAFAQQSGHSTNTSGMPSMQMHKVMQDSNEKSMSMKMTGNVDHDFMMMMRHHHAAGIAMAEFQVANGKDNEMINMAKKIIKDQQREIKELDAWKDKHPLK